MADGIRQARKEDGSLVFIALIGVVAVCAILLAVGITVIASVVRSPAPQLVGAMPGDPLAAASIPLTEIDDGSRVIFTAEVSPTFEASIYAANIDGTDIQRITFNCPDVCTDRHPTVSPDGTRLAYHRYIVEGENYDRMGIYTVGTDGSDTQLLIPGGFSPSWSPDGEQLAFFEVTKILDQTSVLELFVINADGTDKRQITESENITFWPGSAGDRRNISWSPDGQQILFEYGWMTGPGANAFFIVNADGTGLRTLEGDVLLGRHRYPSWSPNGERIVFEVDGTIYTIKPDGTDQRRLGSGSNPVWSPDGQHILFSARYDDPLSETYREYLFTNRGISNFSSSYVAQLFYMNATDGSGVRRITRSTTVTIDGTTSFIGLAGEIDNEAVFDPLSWDANGGDLFSIEVGQSSIDWYQPTQ